MQTIFSDGKLITAARATFAIHPDYFEETSVTLRASILDTESLREEIIQGISTDPDISAHLTNPQLPWSKSTSGLLLHNGCVYVPNVPRLYLKVLDGKHNHPTAGHQGFRKTYELVKREFTWSNMRAYMYTGILLNMRRMRQIQGCST
jgi:hypothetical protein